MLKKNDVIELGTLTPKVIIQLDTPSGYLQVLEYMLQDCSYLHVVQWHFLDVLNEDKLPKINCEMFFRNGNLAIERAYEVGCDLLRCF